MNQTNIGSYIARKRREKNLTQEQLAERLGVSNKTISKWENGKYMPDYSVIEALCQALSITLPELMRQRTACGFMTTRRCSICCGARRSWKSRRAFSTV